MSNDTLKTRGGKRKGAGRKKGNKIYITHSLVLPVQEMEVLRELSTNQKLTISRYISNTLQLAEYVKSKGGL